MALLQKLKLKCKNYEKGCLEVLNYDKVEGHEQICLYNLVKCEAYKFCRVKLPKMEIQAHVDKCVFKSVMCRKCRKWYMRKDE